jgi:hypothetical protein
MRMQGLRRQEPDNAKGRVGGNLRMQRLRQQKVVSMIRTD